MDAKAKETVDAGIRGEQLYQLALESQSKEQKAILLEKSAEMGNADALFDLYKIEESKINNNGDFDIKKAFSYLMKAADKGHWHAQYLAGVIYNTGISPYGIRRDKRKAKVYLEKALESCYQAMQDSRNIWAKGYFEIVCTSLAWIYLKGEGTVIREDKAFELTKRVAYLGYCDTQLAKYYHEGIGVEKNNDEAYIWALIEKARVGTDYIVYEVKDVEFYPHGKFDGIKPVSKKDMSKQLEIIPFPQDCSHRIALQREADRRLSIMRVRPLTDEDVAEFTHQTFTTQNIIQPLVEIEKGTETHNSSPISEGDDISSLKLSDNLEYKYSGLVKKDFDPAKILLALSLHKPLEKTDTVDFDELIVSYNNQNKDRKKISLYSASPVKLNKRARVLLIRLALQFDKSDETKMNARIAGILKDANLGSDVVSSINRLAKSLFPGCFTRRCPFICKDSGELKIRLSINKWMIENAKDFEEISKPR